MFKLGLRLGLKLGLVFGLGFRPYFRIRFEVSLIETVYMLCLFQEKVSY